MLERLGSVPSAPHIDARWRAAICASAGHCCGLARQTGSAIWHCPGSPKATSRERSVVWPLQSQNHSFGGHDGVREQTPSLLGDPVEHVVRVVGVVVEDNKLLGLRGDS